MSLPSPHIETISTVHCRLDDRPWSFAIERAAEIDAHWAALVRANPMYHNGRVFLMHGARLTGAPYGRVLAGGCLITDYKAFVAWRNFGFPETGVRNIFGMAALRSADGAFLLGEMGPFTASPGQIYFPAGTPEPDDLVDDVVDLDGNVMRELTEETGLTAQDVACARGWTTVMQGPRIACMKTMRSPLSAADLAARVADFLAGQNNPELARLVPVYASADIDRGRMPDFIQTYLDHALAGP